MTPTQDTTQVCLLLGSNIAPETNLPEAVALLDSSLEVEAISQVWESPAVGSDGPDFLNAALLVRTGLAPEPLKRLLSAVEKKLGRVRTADKNAPRPIDIDIVVWDCQVVDPDVWVFSHVAVPVSEVLPCMPISDTGESLAQAAARLMEATPIRLRRELAKKQTAH